MADLQGSSQTNETNLDEVIPNVIDTDFLQEQVKGDESFVEELQEKLQPLYVFCCACAAFLTVHSARFQYDQRTWRHRLTHLHRNWKPLIDGMVDAYLRWRYPDNAQADLGKAQDSPPHLQSSSTNGFTTTSPPDPDNNPLPPQASKITCDGGTNDSSPLISAEVDILVIDIYTLSTSIKIPSVDDQTTASSLASLGFIGNAPFHPSVAVSMKTLELYRVLRRRKPSFSIEAFVKVVCDLYMVCPLSFIQPVLTLQKIPYRPKYRHLFLDAFDAYLEVIRAVDKLIKAALGHDTPNWRVLNACPACSYKVCVSLYARHYIIEVSQLENEPKLTYRRMFAVDGNDSLKRITRIGSRDVGDKWCFSDSDYYIPAEEVDEWARENRSTRLAEASGDDSEGDSDGGSGVAEQDKNSDPDTGPCASNWKAAQSDSKKRMWGVFAETGLFASACRHGFILWITDMVRSGEQ